MLSGRDPRYLLVLRYFEGNSLALRPFKHMVEGIFSLRGNEDPFNVMAASFKDRETALDTVVLNPILFIEMGRFILGCTSPSLTLCGTRM